MVSKLKIVFAFMCLFYVNHSYAFETARQLSFSGGGALNPEGIDALLLNPASLNIKTDLSFGGGYHLGDAQKDQDVSAYYAWLKDSVSSSFVSRENNMTLKKIKDHRGFPVAAAFSFGKTKLDRNTAVLSPSVLEFTSYNLSLSSLVNQKLSFGFTYSYLRNIKGQQISESSFSNFYFGLVYQVNSRFKFGLSSIDFFNTSDDDFIDESYAHKMRLSASYALDSIKLYADVQRYMTGVDEDDLDFGLSLESFLKEFVSFRLSAFKRQRFKDPNFGAGISFTGPRLQLNYGFSFNQEEESFRHSVDFSVPLW